MTWSIVQSVRRGQEKRHIPFPARLSFILDNPVRRILDPPSKLVDRLGINPDDSVIDFGCGPGFFTPELAKRAKRVVALDISDKMLARVRKKVLEEQELYLPKIGFIRSDGTKISLPDSSIDMVFLGYAFRELNRKIEVLNEIKRVLKRNGRLIIVERTRLGLNLFGLPLVKASEIIEYLDYTDFKHVGSIQFQTNTIIVAKKDN